MSCCAGHGMTRSATVKGEHVKRIITFLFLLLTFSSAADTGFYALFSPHQGQEAFETIYKTLNSAKKKVYITIYSWSNSKIQESFKTAIANGAELKIVLHPSLAKKKRVIDFSTELESLGAEVKIAKMNMHEKFLIVDDEFLLNTSANLSGGAEKKYSENFIFHSNTSSAGKKLIREFNDEFAILWNSGKDMVTHGEENAKKLEIEDQANLPEEGMPVLLSSSMNFTLKPYKKTSKAYLSGKYIALSRRGGKGNQTWKVSQKVIDEINSAQKNIYLSLNHLNIRAISDALIEAVKRGVDVRLAVDNQEYKRYPNNKEMTPQFVKDWKALKGNSKKEAPVRVKYYSHAPSPRYWFLNHHKYLLIDFDANDASGTTLISGSHNLSRTAEHNQFDNMVVYKGSENKKLFESFKAEFDHLWSLNRDESDKPLATIFNKITTAYKGLIYLHSREPISLSWSETSKVRATISQLAPSLFKNAYKKRDCKAFSLESHQFIGCPSK